MGFIIESTPEMAEYHVEVRGESFYITGENSFEHCYEGKSLPHHGLIVYPDSGPTSGAVQVGTAEILIADIPKIFACLVAIEKYVQERDRALPY